nr:MULTISPECIES: DNA/RNA helicase domain-containing protein [unclassified Leucobacter]
MNSGNEVYVGESLNAAGRIRQHLDSEAKRQLKWVRVILDPTFNKSVCLDLESYLIRMFSGDGKLRVLNNNAGITDANYFDKSGYQSVFEEVFETLRLNEGLFQRSVPEIINSDLFKLSPFKALNHDQAVAVEDILEGLFEDLANDKPSFSIVQGAPGTGKTVVAIYLLKLLEDIRTHDPIDPIDDDSLFSDFFAAGHPELLKTLRIGIVVPQQSLRESIARVFKLTPGLHREMVLTPFQVGESDEPFDLLLVDEAHRLNHRANQASGPQNKKFGEINQRLFGEDNLALTQLDWIRKQSKHVILMLDTGQSVRPADLPGQLTATLLHEATATGRKYPLESQMRVAAGQDYVGYIRSVLSDNPPEKPTKFDGYDLRFFDDIGEMRQEILLRDKEHGLSRLVAGYAWEWRSRNDKSEFDIEIDGERLRWNSTQKDWINSAGSEDEVGSIHTVQGYDLNYAGVIIGNDLHFDSTLGQTVFNRAEYHDKKGRENNKKLEITYSDHDLRRFVQNIYSVLLTRGILGTYVYVCNDQLRKHLRVYFK